MVEPTERRLGAWQRSAIRNNMARYRQAQEEYLLQNKPTVRLDHGQQAFSLVAPPLGSPISRRRVRLIMDNMAAQAGSADSAAVLPPGARSPHVITLAVTYDCQCRCEHCSAAVYQERVRREGSALSLEELKDVAAQAVEMGATCVILTGGEPLLVKGIEDVVRSVDKSKSVCTLFTNGEYLDRPAAARLREAGLYGAFFSLDFPDSERHDRNRGRPGLFAKVRGAVGIARESGLLTGISTYATKENIRNGDLDAMMDLARDLGVLEVFLFDVIPTGRLAAHRECLLNDGDADRVRDFRATYSAKAQYPRIIHQTMFASMAYPCVAEGCPAAVVQVHVRANGDVAPCDFTPCAFGNVRRQPLRDAWAKMGASPLYAGTSRRCRLSSPEFWQKLDAVNGACAS